MNSIFREGFNNHVKMRYTHWLKEARAARIAKDNIRFWYCMMIVRQQRERYMWLV